MTNNGLIFKQVFFILIPNEASALCKMNYLYFNERMVFKRTVTEKVRLDSYFFLCLFALALFLRLCVEILDLFLFLPLGIIV